TSLPCGCGPLHSVRWAGRPTRRNHMSVKRTLLIAGGLALVFAWSGQSANAQGVFTITSPSFKDGERLATKNAGNNKQNPNCVGENVSPARSWSNPPAGTKSCIADVRSGRQAARRREPLGRLWHSSLGDRLCGGRGLQAARRITTPSP